VRNIVILHSRGLYCVKEKTHHANEVQAFGSNTFLLIILINLETRLDRNELRVGNFRD